MIILLLCIQNWLDAGRLLIFYKCFQYHRAIGGLLSVRWQGIFYKLVFEKSCTREIMNFSTNADSSTDIKTEKFGLFFSSNVKIFFINIFFLWSLGIILIIMIGFIIKNQSHKTCKFVTTYISFIGRLILASDSVNLVQGFGTVSCLYIMQTSSVWSIFGILLGFNIWLKSRGDKVHKTMSYVLRSFGSNNSMNTST